MHISWSYLDKKKATIDAIGSFDDMAFIIDHTDEEIAEVKNKMSGVGSPGTDGLPHAHNPKAGEERVIDALDEIDLLKERYRQAEEYMAWFKPAWSQLSEDERYVLDMFFMGESQESGARMVAEHYSVDRSTAFRRKSRAVDHLAALLYGRA